MRLKIKAFLEQLIMCVCVYVLTVPSIVLWYLHFALILHLSGLLLHPSQVQSLLGMS